MPGVDDGDVVAGLAELVRAAQPSDAGADDDHADVVAATLQGEVTDRRRLERLPAVVDDQLHRTERAEHGAGSTCRAERQQQPPTRQ